jgi:protein ATS1
MTSAGHVWACGANGNCQLGLLPVKPPPNNDDAHELQCLSDGIFDSPVCGIASGGNHSIFITASGSAYVAGLNASGQLGKGDHHILEPTKLESRWKMAAAGWEYSVLVDIEGTAVYSCGAGSKGELGLGDGIRNALDGMRQIPKFPPEGTRVVQIAGGLNHVIVLLDSNTVWGWGASRKGRLGNQLTNECFSPILVYDGGENKITHVACGKEFTVIGFAVIGRIEVLGPDKWSLQSDVPKLSKFAWIGCGWTTIHVLKDDGRVVSWGNNSHLQWARDDFGPFSQISCGTEHVVGVDLDGNVCSWGWGEHGNCGPDGFGVNGTGLKVVKAYGKNGQFVTVFGGYASTWIFATRNL